MERPRAAALDRDRQCFSKIFHHASWRARTLRTDCNSPENQKRRGHLPLVGGKREIRYALKTGMIQPLPAMSRISTSCSVIRGAAVILSMHMPGEEMVREGLPTSRGYELEALRGKPAFKGKSLEKFGLNN
jgi:hypothetical protein